MDQELRAQTRSGLSWAGKGIALGQAAALAVALFTLSMFSISAHDLFDYPAQVQLSKAYKAVVGPETRPSAFPSKAVIEARLAKNDPKLVVLGENPSAGYRYLKQHGGQAGVLYIDYADKSHLNLVARVDSGAIEELDTTITRSGPVVKEYRALYSGKMNWSHFWWAVLIENLIISFMAGLLGFVFGAEEETRRGRWQSVVSDRRLGPSKQQIGYSFLWPYSEQQGEQVLMSVKKLIWTKKGDDERWQEDASYDVNASGAITPITVASSIGTPDLSGQWFDFCARVAEQNAQQWKQRQGQRQMSDVLKGIVPENSNGGDGSAATAVLAPAGQVMSQALDAQPLGD